MIELRELRVFLVLAEELHFGRTAERLGVTQSRVSQSLRTLERKLGDELVHRTSRHVALTASGARFRTEVAPAVARLTGVLERAQVGAGHLEGTLRIGLMYPNSGGEGLVRVIDAFEALHPDCEVQVDETPVEEPGRPLRSGEIDFMATPVLRDPPKVVVDAVLGHEPRVLAVARDHPLTAGEEVTLEQLGEFEVAALRILPDDHQETWIPLETPSGRPIRRFRRSIASFDEIAMLVARGKVVHPALPSSAAYFGNANVTDLPIVGLPPTRILLLSRPGAKNPRQREFIRVAREVLHDEATALSTGPTARR